MAQIFAANTATMRAEEKERHTAETVAALEKQLAALGKKPAKAAKPV